MFVKFDCDCVGLIVDDGDPIVIDPCDLYPEESWEPLQICRRSMKGKKHEPLTPEQVAYYIKALNGLVRDGYSLRAVQRIVSAPREDLGRVPTSEKE